MTAAVGLTDAKMKAAVAPPGGRVELIDRVTPGLRLRVGSSGACTFILRKRNGDRMLNLTLGRYSTRFTLADARKAAREALSAIEAGDTPAPVATTRTDASKTTIAGMLPDYLKAKAGRWTVEQIRRVFDQYILPRIGDRRADTITRADVTRVVDNVATGGGREAPAMARNVAAQLSSFYGWALPRLDRLATNPCIGAGKPAKAAARDRVLTADEIRALWKACEAEAGAWGAGVRLLLLTGQRKTEVFAADRAEFNLDAALWTIPAARAKNAKAHLVPLSAAACDVLATVPGIVGSPKLFPTKVQTGAAERAVSGHSRAWKRLLTAVAPESRFIMHDLRRTAATGMQRLGIRVEVTEAVLNHVSGTRGGLAGVYQRHDFAAEKRHALDAWAAELERIVKGEGRDNVVALYA